MSFWQNYFQKRSNSLLELANELDWDFSRKDEYGLISLMRDFKLFRRGHSRKIKNIISYQDEGLDIDVQVFDYQYTISAGNSHRRVSQSVFFVQSKTLELPQFYLRPEDFFQKIAKFFGRQDINFESHPEFSDQYLLQSTDEERLRKTLNQDLLHFFSIEKKWSLEGIGYYLILYRNNKRFKPQELKTLIDKGHAIFDMLSNNLV